MKTTKTTIGIIGAGNVGAALGKKWAKAGYTVLFSSRHPEQLADLVRETGENAEAVIVDSAAKQGDIVVLAVPFAAEETVSKQIAPYVKGKILVLCDNAFPGRDGAIAEEAKKTGVAAYAQQHYYSQVKLVRAFSSLPVAGVARAITADPVDIPYALDDEHIKGEVEQLIKAADGKPRYTGKIKESKSLDF